MDKTTRLQPAPRRKRKPWPMVSVGRTEQRPGTQWLGTEASSEADSVARSDKDWDTGTSTAFIYD